MSKDDITGLLQNVIDGNPILSCGLHANIFAVVFRQPSGTTAQVPSEGGKPLASVRGDALLIGGGYTGDEKRLVDIHSTANRINDFEHNTSPQTIVRGSGRGLDAH